MLISCLLALGAVHPQGSTADQGDTTYRKPSAGFFAENRGQWDREVALALRGEDQDLILTTEGWQWIQRRALAAPIATADNHPAGQAVALLDEDELAMAPDVEWTRVELSWIDAQAVAPELVNRTAAEVRMLRQGSAQGDAPLATGTEALYRQLWPGVDLRFRAEEQSVKHQFELAAGVDPALVQIGIQGAEAELAADGSLVLRTALGEIRDAAPVAWQIQGAERIPVDVSFALDREADRHRLRFELGDYNPELPLVLDPDTLVYCGYIGGSDYEELRGLDVTADGTIFVAGHTSSTDLPVRGAFQGTYGGGDFDVFVASVDANGVLRMLTYLGGSSRELAYDLSLDPAGNAYVVGGSSSPDFPTAVGPYLTHSGNLDGFVTKLAPDGSLIYSGFLGGDQFDSIRGNDVDPNGNHYVIGRSLTDDGSFPVEVGPDLTHNGGFSDVFVAKINPAGDDVIYAGFIGGDEIDYGRDVVCDAQGYAYYVGWTNSDESTFPTVGGPDLTYNGGEEFWGGGTIAQYGDGFLSKVLPDGSGFASSGYVGGTGSDALFSVRLGADGGVYVSGHTTSTEASLPVKFGPDLTFNGAPSTEPYGDALVGKLRPTLNEWEFLGYVGGDDQDRAWRMDVDRQGRIYLVGNTRSDRTTFPHQGTGPRLSDGGNEDAYLAVVSTSGSRVLYGSYFAGSDRETIRDVAVDDDGFVHVAGWSASATFPLVKGPNLIKPGGHDGFVARVLPFEMLLRAGNAIDPATKERTDLLFVNGAVGDGFERRMFLPWGGSPITIDVEAVGYDGTPLTEADFVLYLWEGEPSAREAAFVVDPSGRPVGTAAFPTPLSGATQNHQNLHTLINTTGRHQLLGAPIIPTHTPAPYTLDVEVPAPGTYTLQALIEDPNKPSGITLSNVVVLVVQ